MSKAQVISRLCADRLIAVMRADSAEQITDLATALANGGITNWELPMTCPAVPDYLAEVSPQFPDFQFGLSTVIDVETARRGILAGAKFISTPALRPQVILLCRRQQIPVICGVHSQEEMDAAILAGADVLKLYPSETRFGSTHMGEMRELYPETRLFPVGGVTPENVGDFFDAGADAAFVSSCLQDPSSDSPVQLTEVTRIARSLIDRLSASNTKA